MNLSTRLALSHISVAVCSVCVTGIVIAFISLNGRRDSIPGGKNHELVSRSASDNAPGLDVVERKVIIALVGVALASVVGACLAAIWVAKELARPIKELSEAIKIPGNTRQMDAIRKMSSLDEVHCLADAYGALMAVQAKKETLQTQLQQTRAMDSIGQLAGGVAYDFNNLLSGILGAADLLARRIDGSDDRRKFVDLITETAQRATDLTSRLLAFSRKGDSISSTLNVHDVIRASFAILERTLEDKRVTFRHELQADPPLVTGDAGQLQNVIINLVMNSRDAMPDGGELIVSTQLASLEKDYCDASPFDLDAGIFIEISFRDTGIGMPADLQSRIFEPFFTSKEVGLGMGLGLAAVYGAVKDHHGAVTVHSEVDKGTTFNIYLPVDVDGEIETSVITDIPAPQGEGFVLLVDDEEVIRITAGCMLHEIGYHVIFATNGMEAVEMFTKYRHKIDLIILDLVMPVMDGRDTLREILKRDNQANIIISSGFSCDSSTRELLDDGACKFLRKPFRYNDLLQVMSELAVKGQMP